MTTYAGAALDDMTRKLKSARAPESNGWNSMLPDQPKDCFVCGKPVRISRDDCGFRTMDPKISWHFACVQGWRTLND